MRGEASLPFEPHRRGKSPHQRAADRDLRLPVHSRRDGPIGCQGRGHCLPAATLLREALGLTETRRRKPIPSVDPALVLAVGRIGGNLNQIAQWLNRAMLAGRTDLDALTVARRMLTIERQLAQIVEAARRC
ncbi:mobilization protein MobC-like protein [Roseobacter litoralis Och 149]|uniref:Mobilization protein MobC-like protein n=1 Tax=Roseobacter litoralis (strain ATCC 49566 / DSM 6996 / JCM 21268 / NBRC 15278 / OCh 149) TaxID=391595 RepID=F7ZJ86_ROSLO|nr:mobilization protein MobC-like protein [Roseobacter litoralis Och 149]